MTIQIVNVRLGHDRDDLVVVTFNDGHKATFVESQGGWGMATTLERIWLERGQQTVAMYHSPYQYPVNHRPFGFREQPGGLSRAQAAIYWKMAFDHIAAEHREGRLRGAWNVISKGIRDIEELYAAPA